MRFPLWSTASNCSITTWGEFWARPLYGIWMGFSRTELLIIIEHFSDFAPEALSAFARKWSTKSSNSLSLPSGASSTFLTVNTVLKFIIQLIKIFIIPKNSYSKFCAFDVLRYFFTVKMFDWKFTNNFWATHLFFKLAQKLII